jgi:hypothetical protein
MIESIIWACPKLRKGRAIHSKYSPLVPHGCGLSVAIPHAGKISKNSILNVEYSTNFTLKI